MKRHFVSSILGAAFLVAVFTMGESRSVAATPEAVRCSEPAAEAAPAGSSFQGCWGYFSSGPFYSIYKDDAGNYTRCGECTPSGGENPNNCTPIAKETLSTGYWSS